MASVTVSLEHPITGAELMNAVKAVAEQNGKEFYTAHDYVDGDIYQIGQVSGYPDDHLLISPAGDEESVRPEASYDKVSVASHQWPVSIYLIGYSDREAAFISSVRTFATALEQHLSGAPVAEESSVWPQTVTVCALCERIVSADLDWQYCAKDGKNPPTCTMQVTPVTA